MIEPSTILAVLAVLVPIGVWLIPAEPVRDLLKQRVPRALLLAIAVAGVAKVSEIAIPTPVPELFLRLWPVWLGVAVAGLYWYLPDYRSLRSRFEVLERASTSLAAADTEISRVVTAVDARVTEVDELRKKLGRAAVDVVNDLTKRVADLEGRVAGIEDRVYDDEG